MTNKRRRLPPPPPNQPSRRPTSPQEKRIGQIVLGAIAALVGLIVVMFLISMAQDATYQEGDPQHLLTFLNRVDSSQVQIREGKARGAFQTATASSPASLATVCALPAADVRDVALRLAAAAISPGVLPGSSTVSLGQHPQHPGDIERLLAIYREGCPG